jgi:hypothetical protein
MLHHMTDLNSLSQQSFILMNLTNMVQSLNLKCFMPDKISEQVSYLFQDQKIVTELAFSQLAANILSVVPRLASSHH